MSEQTQDPAPQSESAPPPAEEKTDTPPWGEDFDPARAWKTIQNLREREKELTPLAQKAQELEEAQKSETQRLTEERDALKAERDAERAEALRLRVAAEKGLTPKQAARLRGSTAEELAADADELLGEFSASGSRRYGDVDQGVRPRAAKAPLDPGKAADEVIARRGY